MPPSDSLLVALSLEPRAFHLSTRGGNPTVSFGCINCGKRFKTSTSAAGQSTDCPGCGATLIVPKPDDPQPVAPPPTEVSFGCRLCGTRMTVPTRHVGRKVKCPDCTALTVVPPPEAPAKSRRPAAMDGDQYEVYEGEQPLGIDLARSGPQYVAVTCRVCQTLMQAEASAVGQAIECHDCGAKTRVPAVAATKAPPRAAETEAYDVIDEPQAVAVTGQSLFDEYAAKPPAGYRNLARDTDKAGEAPVDQPAAVVGWGVGLFAGMHKAFGTSGMGLAWLGLSAGLVFTAPMAGFTFGLLDKLGSVFSMIGGVLLVGVVLITTFIWVGVAAAILWAVLESTASGSREVNDWPSIDVTEWFGPSLNVLFALVVAAIPGALLAQAFMEQLDPPWPFDTTFGWLAASWWLVLPWVLLSQLDGSSPWAVFSPRLVRTLAYAPVTWLAFYATTLAMGLGDLWVSAKITSAMGAWAVFALCPIEVLLNLVYFWLIGRLAWVAGSKTPEKV